MTTKAPLPPIPDKRYFTIGEVSRLCQLKPHVLRYWEQEFPQLRPSKRRGNRRYYQVKDVEVVRRIRELLYEQGFTINGARQQLKELTQSAPAQDNTPAPENVVTQQQPTAKKAIISESINELEAVLELLEEV